MKVLEITEESASIEKLRAYEIEEARNLQQAMVPKEPIREERFEIAHRFRPAASVGGDFLDYFYLQDGTVGFYLGDVVGKGLPAALYAALAVGTFRGIHKSGEHPVRVLELLNRRLRMRQVPGRFCSVQYAVLEPAKRLLHFVNAGLPLPLHISDRGCRQLGDGGIPAGMFEDTTYSGHTIQLAAGDSVIFLTDGLSEARGRDDLEFGREPLLSLCESQPQGGTQEILDAVFSAWQGFVGPCVQHDDIAVAALKVF